MDAVPHGRYNPDCRMSAPAEAPISPELVLVASPEEAERARRSLPLPEAPLPRFPDILSSPAVRDRARRNRRVVLAAIGLTVLGAFGAAAAIVVLHDPGAQQAAVLEQPSARTVAPTRTQAPRHAARKPSPKPKPTRTTATKPAQTTAAKPAQTPTAKPAQTTAAKPPPTAKRSGSTSPQAPAASPRKAKATFVPARVFAWPAQPGASAYLVRFFRGSTLVFEKKTTAVRLTLPRTFHFVPGSYRWLVLPIDEHGVRGAPIVESRFDVA
jgi:hypothetical protein